MPVDHGDQQCGLRWFGIEEREKPIVRDLVPGRDGVEQARIFDNLIETIVETLGQRTDTAERSTAGCDQPSTELERDLELVFIERRKKGRESTCRGRFDLLVRATEDQGTTVE